MGQPTTQSAGVHFGWYGKRHFSFARTYLLSECMVVEDAKFLLGANRVAVECRVIADAAVQAVGLQCKTKLARWE